MRHVVKTDVGVVRSENQDRAAAFVGRHVTFAILCDGMGGHTGGSYASSITIATFEKEFNKAEPTIDNVTSWFAEAIKKSIDAMKKQAEGNAPLMDMGTTVTAAAIFDKKILIINVGDSRTYVYNGLLHQITVDHNLRNYYIEHYGYSEDEAAQLVGAAALTSALGPTKTVRIEPFEIDRDDSTRFVVLTSDGIHDYIAKPVFESILSRADSIEEKGEELIARAIKGKSSDNLTCLIVDLKGE